MSVADRILVHARRTHRRRDRHRRLRPQEDRRADDRRRGMSQRDDRDVDEPQRPPRPSTATAVPAEVPMAAARRRPAGSPRSLAGRGARRLILSAPSDDQGHQPDRRLRGHVDLDLHRGRRRLEEIFTRMTPLVAGGPGGRRAGPGRSDQRRRRGPDHHRRRRRRCGGACSSATHGAGVLLVAMIAQRRGRRRPVGRPRRRAAAGRRRQRGGQHAAPELHRARRAALPDLPAVEDPSRRAAPPRRADRPGQAPGHRGHGGQHRHRHRASSPCRGPGAADAHPLGLPVSVAGGNPEAAGARAEGGRSWCCPRC